jgi:hypothetical protein
LSGQVLLDLQIAAMVSRRAPVVSGNSATTTNWTIIIIIAAEPRNGAPGRQSATTGKNAAMIALAKQCLELPKA